MSEAIENIKQAFSVAIEIANIFINTLWAQDKKKAKPIHDKLQAAFDLHRESITELHAENKELRLELQASDNWLHRLLKSCVIFLDDGEVTKRAVEKQSRYNQRALTGGGRTDKGVDAESD